jgi:hypothetical protein
MLTVSKDYDDLQKAQIAEKLAQADKCLQDGADESLQLMAVLAFCLKTKQ